MNNETIVNDNQNILRERLLGLAEIEVTCIPEHVAVKGNVLASGDDIEDMKAEERVIEQLEQGNTWAWCTIAVKVSFGAFSGEAYLGCCSYKSEADFLACEYYKDMHNEAIEALVLDINYNVDKLQVLGL